jgi:hypothetical protein
MWELRKLNLHLADHLVRPSQLASIVSSGQITFFFELHKYRRSTRMHTHPYEYVCKLYPFEHLRKTMSVHLEIDEVTACVSLSTGTSPTTKSITLLNPRINLEKYEYPCQVEDVNLGE